MKKKYIAPKCEVIMIDAEELICLSAGGTADFGPQLSPKYEDFTIFSDDGTSSW